MASTFNTGNNRPTHKGVARDVAKIAVDFYDCTLEAPIADAGGIYAYRLVTGEGQPFYLVAKGSRLWIPKDVGEPVISIQRTLLITCIKSDRQIVLGWRPDPRERLHINWYRIDPQFALDYGFETNKRSPESGRPQTVMWNFPLRLAEPIDGPQDVAVVTTEYIKQTKPDIRLGAKQC